MTSHLDNIDRAMSDYTQMTWDYIQAVKLLEENYNVVDALSNSTSKPIQYPYDKGDA